MKRFLLLISAIAISGCTALPAQQSSDAAAITQGGAQLTSAFGAKVTGRDWANPSPDSKGGTGGKDGVGNL